MTLYKELHFGYDMIRDDAVSETGDQHWLSAVLVISSMTESCCKKRTSDVPSMLYDGRCQVDFAAQSVYNSLTEQQKKFAHCAEQIQKVGEIASTLNRVHQTVEQMLPVMQRLNGVLPESEQLEPFSFTDSGASAT